MDRVEHWLRQVEHTARRPVAARVGDLLEAIRRGCQRYEGESWDRANERHAEEFIARLRDEFAGRVLEIARPPAGAYQQKAVAEFVEQALADSAPRVIVERQKLPLMALRTTSSNYTLLVYCGAW